MNVVEFLASLANKDIRLWLEGDNLRFSAPEGVFTPDLRDQVVANKPAIIEFLRQARKLNEAAIETVDRSETLLTSYGQQRLWILNQLNPSDLTYNMTSALRIRGPLQVDILDKVLRELVQRHESLRTCFREFDGEPLQIILPAEQWQLLREDLSGLTPSQQQEVVQDWVNKEAITPYDLAVGPLFRARLLCLSEDHFVLVAGMHHIISDAWSMDVLTRELGALYMAFSAGLPSPLLPLPIQYADYAAWQRQQMASPEMESHLQYWQQTLAGAPQILALPTDRPRQDLPSNHGALFEAQVPVALAAKIQAACRRLDLTPFMFFLGGWQLLLGRYANSEDVVVGSPIAGRSRTETQELIGFFVNLLLMRLDMTDNPTIAQFYQRVKAMSLGAFSHQDLPVDRLMEAMAVERQPGYPPLAQAAFQLINLKDMGKEGPLVDAAVGIEPIPSSHVAARMDLLMAVAQTGDQFDASLEYNTDLFDHRTVSSMMDQYLFLLDVLAGPEHVHINDVELYDDRHLLAQLGCDPEQDELLALNANQLSMVLDQLAHPDTIQNAYGIYADLPLKPNLETLQRAIQVVVDASPVLRTRLLECSLPAAEVAYGVIPGKHPVILEWINLDNDQHGAVDIHQATLNYMHRPYNVFNDTLVTYQLLHKQGCYRLVIACHHIILDGASTYLLMDKILQVYNQISDKPDAGAIELSEDWGAFAYQNWSRGRADKSATLAYWQQQAANSEPLDYSFSKQFRVQGKESTFSDQVVSARLDHRQVATIREHCQNYGINLPLYFKLLFSLMLQHYCRPESGFRYAEFYACRQGEWQDALGCFYQQFPCVIPDRVLNGGAGLDQWYSALKMARDSARDHRMISLQEQSRLMPNGRAVFMFNYYNFVSQASVQGVEVKPIMSAPKVDGGVQFIVKESGLEIELELRFDATVFNDFQFLPRLLHLNEQLQFDPPEQLSELQFLSAAEQMRVHQYSEELPLDPHANVVKGFESIVDQYPHLDAVISFNQKLTFAELNVRANQLAHYLIDQGVGPNCRVALCFDRGVELMVAVLGVLKAGAAYVPVDPSYPVQRIAHMLQDSGSQLIISLAKYKSVLESDAQVTPVFLDEIGNRLAELAISNPDVAIDPEQQIYVIYTSGSTGLPKGAMVTHHGEINLQRWYLDLLDIGPEDRTLMISAVGFDLTQKNLFAPLLVGAAIVMPDMDVFDEQLLLELVEQHQISWINCAPSAFYPLVELGAANQYKALSSIRYLVLGGEPIQLAALTHWMSNPHCQAKLVNSYGPTECTDVVAYHVVNQLASDMLSLPIGKPVPNTRIYLLNELNQQVVPGCVGEMCVAGYGVGLGYINRQELTDQVFVDMPHEPGKVYRTGDLGRLLPDGTLEYIGRKDHQIKLRGLRIELGEIEHALQALDGVDGSLVLVHGEQLVAYLLAAQEPEHWRQQLRQYLPEYMVPSVLVCVPHWPLTPNGKIDRKALPEPSAVVVAQEYVAPRTETEAQLASIWQQVLQQDTVGVLDNLFDLGGNSLLATRIVSRVKKHFDIPLAVRELFVAPTIAELAVIVDRAEQTRNIPPITAGASNTPSPLSFAQQRLWFLDQLEPESTAYNLPGAFRLYGALQVSTLQQALQIIVARHEVLRSTVQSQDDEPVMIIHDPAQWSMDVEDLSLVSAEQQQIAVRHAISALYDQVFDLGQGPLFCARLLLLGREQAVFLINMHHIVTDGWSNGILMRELGMIYDALSHGRMPPLPALTVQYRDFARWQREWLTGEELERQVGYWRNALSGVEVLGLPTDRKRSVDTGSAGCIIDFELNSELTSGLNRICRQYGTSLYMVTLAAYMILLSRYSGQDDIAVGSPIANRNFEEIEPLIGFFVNTLVIRGELERQSSFACLLKQVQQKTLDAYAHQDVPFERLVDELVTERDMLHSPLFQVLFSVQNMATQQDVVIPGVKLERIPHSEIVAKFDLEFSLMEQGGVVLGEVVYRTALFDQETVARLVEHYLLILQQVVAEPEKPLQEISLVSGHEMQALLGHHHNTCDYNKNITIHELFEQQVDCTPNAVALIQHDRSMTYDELERSANQLARYLIEHGVAEGDIVALMLPRSFEFMISLLAVLKCGATYLPVDPSYPNDRIDYMLADSEVGVVITADGYNGYQVATHVDFSSVSPTLQVLDDSRLPTRGDAENLLYVIYTSGSTGKPKGTGARHRAEVNLLNWYQRDFGMSHDDRVLLLSAIGFDLTQKNFFAPLLAGAALVLPSSHDFDPMLLLQDITDHSVTWLNCAPNAFYPLLEEDPSYSRLASLRWVFLGGEPIDLDRVQAWARSGVGLLVNSYGPTECADIATFHVLNDLDRYRHGTVPIGKAIDNVKLYILDDNLQPVPQGLPGELCIGGDSVGPGYFNNPQQTEDKFIPNPVTGDGSLIYRTGDLARFLRDGDVDYLGRIDTQVKIRGFRIEPAEIEVLLRQVEGVSASCVIVREDSPGQKALVAYVVSSMPRAQSEYREFLRRDLPDFMVPAVVMELPVMPLTPNGKIARNQLPLPQYEIDLDLEFESPATDIEQKVLAIWQSVLQRESISVTADFFSVGGQSLLATQVMSRLRREFQTNLALRVLFEAPTIRNIALQIQLAQEQKSKQLPPVTIVDRDGDLPLSFVQQQLWLLDQLDPGTPAYNMPIALRIKGDLDVEQFQLSFNQLIQRHETLRSNFVIRKGTPQVIIHPERPFTLEFKDLSLLDVIQREAEIQRLAREQMDRGFDLRSDILLRGELLLLQKEPGSVEHVLVGAIHHIVSDGWSLNVITHEVMELYQSALQERQPELPELPIQYVDIASWQRSWLSGDTLAQHLEYWRQKLDNEGQVLHLQSDFPRPPVMTSNGAQVAAVVPKSSVDLASALAREEGATLFMVLVAVYKLLLHKYTGQSHINVGTPIAGRDSVEMEHLVGFFINTVVLSSEIQSDFTLRELLRSERETTLGAYAHQALPFEKLVEELRPPRDPSRTPFFQAFINLLNLPTQAGEGSPLQMEAVVQQDNHHHAKYDFNLYVSETGQGNLELVLVYNSDLYRADTAQRFVNHFVQLFSEFSTRAQDRIREISLLSSPAPEWLPDLSQAIEKSVSVSPLALFMEQARKYPDAIAIKSLDSTLSYRDLEHQSRRVAKALQQRGLAKGAIVSILATRNTELVVALLGILRAGCAFNILDAAYPVDRLQQILNLTESAMLLDCCDQAELASGLAGQSDHIVAEALVALVNVTADGEIEESNDLNALAYVSFTSGSTGVPKGIAANLEPLAHFTQWYCAAYNITRTDCFSLLSGLAHDPLLRDIFVPLSAGGTIAIPGPDWMLNPETMQQWLMDSAVTVAHLTPSMASLLLETVPAEASLPGLRLFGVGGDRLPASLVEALHKWAPGAQVAGFYGATETPQVMAVFNSPSHCEGLPEFLPIGHPIDAVEILIQDESGSLCAVGQAGEIVIRTPYLSMGYLQSGAHNGFRNNPLSGDPDDRLYCTGDLGRYRLDGSVEFLGRKDQQIKIRGYRVEPADIELAIIDSLGSGSQAVVRGALDPRGDDCLVAYVRSSGADPEPDLRSALRLRLPEYMVPALIVPIEAIPLNRNGKVDWRKLPDPSGLWSAHEYVAPRNDFELQIAGIWQAVLRIDRISVVDHFFDVGGHSLLAVQIVSRVKEQYGIEFSMRRLLEIATIEGMASYVENALWVRDGQNPTTTEVDDDDDFEELEI